MCSLPPILPTKGGSSGTASRPEFRCPVMKLPPWDQPAVINWEPLEPPSPYVPTLPQRAYPSVAMEVSRGASLRAKRQRGFSMSSENTVPTEESRGILTLEEEEAYLIFLAKDESKKRDAIIFSEQREFTHLWVEFLHHVSLSLDDNIQRMEEESRSAYERDESRRRMCYAIEMESGAWLIRRRFQDVIRKKMSEFMPAYNKGRNCIMEEEASELSAVLDWFKKKRPFGMRLPRFFGENAGPQCPKKPIGRQSRALERDRRRTWIFRNTFSTACSRTDSWPDAFPEASYQEEGRRAWRYDKELRHYPSKAMSRTGEVERAWEIACKEILSEEAGAWLNLMALYVEEYHDAKQRAGKREKAQLIEEVEHLEELQRYSSPFVRSLSETAFKKDVAAVEDAQRRDTPYARLEGELSINDELAALEKLKRQEAEYMLLEHETFVANELAMLEGLKRREAFFLRLRNEMSIESELAVLEELKRRETEYAQLEDAMIVENELAALEDLKRREAAYVQLEYETFIANEVVVLERLKRREAFFLQLENETFIAKELAMLEDLKERERMFEQDAVDESDALAKEKSGTPLMSDFVHPASTDHHGHVDACLNSGLGEGSSSCDSDLHGAPLHPMLNVVLGVALERDPCVALRNPALPALGDAERVIAACEGRTTGRAARALSVASRVPFSLVYLVHALWCPPPTRDAAGPGGAADERTARLEQTEAEGRAAVVGEQILAVWELYQRAAADASRVSKTNYGEVFYAGVCMPSEI